MALSARDRGAGAGGWPAGLGSGNHDAARAVDQRGDEMSRDGGVLHARRTDRAIADWLARAEEENKDAADAVATSQLRHIRRSFERNTKVPADLAEALARLTSTAQGVWASARAGDDIPAFLPVLSEVIALRRRRRNVWRRGAIFMTRWWMTMNRGPRATVSNPCSTRCAPVLSRCAKRFWRPQTSPTQSGEPSRKRGRLALARDLAGCFGYDFSKGPLTFAVHPLPRAHGRTAA